MTSIINLNDYPNLKETMEFLDTVFSANNHEIRLVGGAVRDLFLGHEPKDLDFCTTATPDQMQKIVDSLDNKQVILIPTGLQHGTITLKWPQINYQNNSTEYITVEVTTLRKDVECDGRWAEVEFTNSWEEDAARRDFTINAMSMDADGKVYDYFNGIDDIQNGIVKFVGNPEERIKEDALRMLRWCRFTAKYHPRILNVYDGEDFKTIKKLAPLINDISVERVWNDFCKCCSENNASAISTYLSLMNKSSLSYELYFPASWSTFINNSFKWSTSFRKSFDLTPCFVIASQIETLQEAERFCKKFKLSLKEREEVYFYVKYRGIDLNIYSIMEIIEQYGNDTNKWRKNWRQWLINTVELIQSNSPYIAIIPKIDVPIFPVTAQDILDLDCGYKQSRKLGDEVEHLRNIWKNSGYLLTRDRLLKQVRTNL